MTDMPVEGNRARLRIAADVGGTFTHIATFDVATGVLGLGKALTTPTRLVEGISHGVDRAGGTFAEARLFLHGTTVAINASCSTRKGWTWTRKPPTCCGYVCARSGYRVAVAIQGSRRFRPLRGNRISEPGQPKRNTALTSDALSLRQTMPMTADLRSRSGNRKFDGQVYCEFAVAVVNGAMGCISHSLERGSISWSVGP